MIIFFPRSLALVTFVMGVRINNVREVQVAACDVLYEVRCSRRVRRKIVRTRKVRALRIAGDAQYVRDFIKSQFPTALNLMETHPSAQELANLELILFGTWQELVSLLTDHHEQEVKDGPCFVPGRLLGSQRKETDVMSLGLAMLDVDNGEDIERICAKIEAAGYEALVHTTHSHNRSRSSIKLSVYTRHADRNEIRPDLLAEYLVKSRRILPHLVQDLRITKLPDAGDEDGVIEVEHAPIAKCRIALPLPAPRWYS